MTTLQLINYIASHSEFVNVVISDCDDKTPMQAIELLSSERFDNTWQIKELYPIGTLLVYNRGAVN